MNSGNSASNRPDKYELVETIQREIRRHAPGLSAVLNLHSKRKYGISFANLLLMSPSKAYRLLTELYGNERGRLVAELVISKPLAALAKSRIDPNQLLKLAEKGKDAEILRMLGLFGFEAEAEKTTADMSAVISEALSCAILIEELTSNIYKRLADCAGGVTSIAFTYIASESSTHADIFGFIAKDLGIDVDENKCPVEPGGLMEQLKKMNRKLSEECPRRTELFNILRFLASLEEHVGEEDYTRILIPALRTVMSKKDIDVYETILESIIRDEENHATILQRVYERLSSLSQSTGHSERQTSNRVDTT
ncbi:hypothetical protein Pdsh_01015 [Pyrodictium delaneyi]|uniref:Rubrerythrin diiron-binding domain-containing protein n=1 Tax=Pyrodictium delaneyi TaxID=1273541 RepID=A0A211YQY2_9CREN|nr:hypothetical protein Pdsh_01015 [Pyrodictium delaneyi]